jgi:hypothetical protein
MMQFITPIGISDSYADQQSTLSPKKALDGRR